MVTTQEAAAPIVPLLCDGKWITPQAEAYTDVHNPSTEEVIGRTPMCGAAEVDAATKAASRAFEGWSRLPATQRAALLFRYRERLEAHFDELSRLVTRENGKTLEEPRGDVRRGIEVVEFACGIGHLLKGETLPQVADQIDAHTTREPVGVCAGITPFNFPAMIPLWMFPLAIACGNTFILKPSEKVPLTAWRLGELLLESGLPAGVFNIVQGGRAVVEALCTHPRIAAISFVGSSAVARHVYQTGCAHGKRVQAAGGAKNVLLVMPDAAPDPTLRAIMGSAFGCAGQRCMAGSILMGIGEAGDTVRAQVVGAMERLKVADTSSDPGAEMGPVIDGPARERVTHAIGHAAAEGALLVRDGRGQAPSRGFFVGPTLLDQVTPEMNLFENEVSGRS